MLRMKLKSKILSVVMALSLIVGMMSGISMTSKATEPDLYLGDVQISSTSSGTNWAYDQSSKTLTLNNYSYSGAAPDRDSYYATIYARVDLTIVLVGENNITNTQDDQTSAYVIKCANGVNSLTIKGNGTLNATGRKGIFTGNDGSISIEGSTVNITTNGNQYASGIRTNSNNVTIKDNSKVTINITDSSQQAANGIECKGDLLVKDSTVKVLNNYGYGLVSIKNTTFENSNIEAISSGTDSKNIAIQRTKTNDGTIRFIGSNVIARGAKAIEFSEKTDGELHIEGGTLQAIGTISAIGDNTTVYSDIGGTRWLNADGTGTKENFEASSTGQSLSNYKKVQFPSIAKASATAPTAINPSYTGMAQALVNAGFSNEGTLQYALGTDSSTPPETGWSTSVPSATDKGTYYVWYKVIGDNDHFDSDPACVTVTIKETSPTPNPNPNSGNDGTVSGDTTDSTQTTSTTKAKTAPKTGDVAKMMLPVLVIMFVMSATFVIVRRKNKQK